LTDVALPATLPLVIKNWRHKGIKEVHETGKSKLVPPNLLPRVIRILDLLDEAENLNDLAIPSYQTHRLKGTNPPRYSMWVNGPWRITFQFEGGNALLVDLEQYH
jgi:proteic killer suppression protein